ncbi:MAG: hypothetical protein AMXMBFR45_14180 [Gammaproteobacteria bacterium]|nr:hypothetical protein [Gammaproteobacteria bacterium]MDL1879925.1 hypothetical protein [Gammaproteobacteria bacterium PRO2]
MHHCLARRDPRLRATVTGVRELCWKDAAGPGLPVRGGSSLAWFGNRLAVAQDSADAVALVDPADAAVDMVPVPRRADDPPRFDFEACAAIGGAGQTEALLLFSSGSRSPPWRVAVLCDPARPRITVYAADALYAVLHATTTFTGGVLNIEGALAQRSGLRLFNRGGRGGSNASLDLPRRVLPLQADAVCASWRPGCVTRYELGSIEGVALGFTDVAAATGGGTLYLAAAEDSAGPAVDGAVAGSALGIIRRGRARWIELREAGGAVHAHKLEGLCLDPADPNRGWAISDPDDASLPARLCRIELQGPW